MALTPPPNGQNDKMWHNVNLDRIIIRIMGRIIITLFFFNHQSKHGFLTIFFQNSSNSSKGERYFILAGRHFSTVPRAQGGT